MNKPEKPNIIIPESFAENGVKTDFDSNKILNGFDRIQPDVLAGDNLNKFIDDTYKGLNYALSFGDYIDNKVSKSGDTMTGVLYFKFDDNFDYSQTTTTQEAFSGIVDFTDENGNLCGQISNYINTSNNLVTSLNAIRSVNGEIKRSSIYAFVDGNGNAKTQAPTPASSDNSTQIATTAFVKSVLSSSGNGLATISKASTGSCEFNSGLIINWGRTKVGASTTATATFKTPFTSTNYKVVTGLYYNNAGSQKNYTTYTYTTTNFVIYNGQGNEVNYDWLAIGY